MKNIAQLNTKNQQKKWNQKCSTWHLTLQLQTKKKYIYVCVKTKKHVFLCVIFWIKSKKNNKVYFTVNIKICIKIFYFLYIYILLLLRFEVNISNIYISKYTSICILHTAFCESLSLFKIEIISSLFSWLFFENKILKITNIFLVHCYSETFFLLLLLFFCFLVKYYLNINDIRKLSRFAAAEAENMLCYWQPQITNQPRMLLIFSGDGR